MSASFSPQPVGVEPGTDDVVLPCPATRLDGQIHPARPRRQRPFEHFDLIRGEDERRIDVIPDAVQLCSATATAVDGNHRAPRSGDQVDVLDDHHRRCQFAGDVARLGDLLDRRAADQDDREARQLTERGS